MNLISLDRRQDPLCPPKRRLLGVHHLPSTYTTVYTAGLSRNVLFGLSNPSLISQEWQWEPPTCASPKLNQAIWERGVKSVSHRLRLKLERKRNDEENAKEKLFTYVSHVPVVSFKGLQTQVVDAE